MARGEAKRIGWFPLRGSWEESVLSWNEQVDMALRHRKGLGLRFRQGELKARPQPPDLPEESVDKEAAKQAPLAP